MRENEEGEREERRAGSGRVGGVSLGREPEV